MGRHKMVFGTCRLCGEKTLLSFEHVPPRVAFNKQTKYKSVDFKEFIKEDNPLENPPKGKEKQGGIGYNSFCKSCNSFLGSKYVPLYQRWFKAGMEILENVEFKKHSYRINDINPDKILKQIVSMFLAINDEWYLKAYPELSKFVKDVESKDLPEKFRIYCYLSRAENIRYMNHVVKGSFRSGDPINCSEISFPPYGYVLTIDNNMDIPYLTNITSFKNFTETISLNMNMFQLPTYMPFPLDYRTKKEIEEEIRKNSI